MSIKSFFRNKIWKTTEPWADIGYDGKKLVVRGYNKAFVNDLRVKLGDLSDGKSDEEIVNLFVERENIEMEEPYLDVLHLGIEDNGQVKVQLDWNKAFIHHLKKHGITGETEEEAIENYLKILTHNQLEGNTDSDEFFSKEQLEAAFKDWTEMEKELDDELEEAKQKAKRRKH